MNIELKNANRMPVPTWRWLKMNATTISCDNPGNYVNVKPQVSDLPAEIELTHTKNPAFPQIVTGAGKDTNDFLENHAAQVNYFTIKENAEVAKPVVLAYELADNNFAVEDNYIYAKANSKATIIIAHNSPYDASGLHGSSVKVYAEENAHVKIVQLQTLGKDFYNIDDIGTTCADNAIVEITQLELGAKRNWLGVNMALPGTKSEAHLQTKYLTTQDQNVDMNYVVDITGKKTDSTIISDGILMHNAKKLLRGTLDFKRGCKGSVGNESENVLLLDGQVENKSIPTILCGEEDIEGNHSASIGEMDEGQLFYLRTRGLSDQDIRHMQIESRTQLMCNDLPEQLHSSILTYKQEAFKNE